MSLARLLELKCAVYLSKQAHEGMELAAKDLADVVHLMQASPQRIGEPLLASAHPAVKDERNRIWRSIKGKGGGGRRPGRRSGAAPRRAARAAARRPCACFPASLLAFPVSL